MYKAHSLSTPSTGSPERIVSVALYTRCRDEFFIGFTTTACPSLIIMPVCEENTVTHMNYMYVALQGSKTSMLSTPCTGLNSGSGTLTLGHSACTLLMQFHLSTYVYRYHTILPFKVDTIGQHYAIFYDIGWITLEILYYMKIYM